MIYIKLNSKTLTYTLWKELTTLSKKILQWNPLVSDTIVSW